jgi:NDP-sugar pyrophosphorylase family protein
MSFRVCIPTAGTGSRLGTLTRFVNKSLVSVANRPILCHLVDRFPPDTEFVIALGHLGHLVREFVALAYPDRTFLFADVTPFEGPGSGLGLSLLACSEHLQQPFVFISCDTLVEEPIPPPNRNWMGYAETNDLQPYRTLEVTHDSVSAIHEKGVKHSGTRKAYIGLAGIHDYAVFWDAMRTGGGQAGEAGEAHGMRALSRGSVQALSFTWHDTGNPVSLKATRKRYQVEDAPKILEKANEAIWFQNQQAIKFSDDERFIGNRVARAQVLGEYFPRVTASTAHMYRYPLAHGKVLSEVVTRPLFAKLLRHCERFWMRAELDAVQTTRFRRTAMVFYKDKTLERVALFYRTFGRKDGTEAVNGVSMPKLETLLEHLDWDWLADGLPGRFHGDFHFENILWDQETQKFTFLDWRQDFGGDLHTGDIYYDLAKLLHGLIINHALIAEEQYTVDWRTDQIAYDFHRKQKLVECERLFDGWLLANGYDVRKVQVLTALIFLNIAALHHHPYGLLLYALGKDMLFKSSES